jgi:imidazolonepropionase-like amidohydrolase
LSLCYHLQMIVLLLLLAASAWAQAPPVVFENLTLIDTPGAAALPGMRVLTRGDRIAAVGKRVPKPKGALVVDGRGKYLIFGLADMHVHLRGGKDLVEDNESWLKLFLANGITTIRDMGGDIGAEVLRWRGEIHEGKRDGPRILTCGPKLDGPKPSWPGSIPVTTPEEGRAAVRTVKAMGADFVKLYFGAVSPEIHTAILDEAQAQHLPVTGHLPGNLSFREVIARGQNIEHGFYPVLDGASTKAAEIRAEFAQSPDPHAAAAFQLMQRRLLDSFDPARVPQVAEQLKQTGTWVTMTLTIAGRLLSLPADNHASHPLRKYMYPGIWETWDIESGRRKRPAADALRQRQELVRVTKEAVPVFHRVGVNMLAGSDCGASNNFAWPGWSLHEELAAFVEAGLSPLAALQLATRSAARFLKEDRERGTIEKGKIADLVLLDANPLEDIRNTQKIAGVMARGKWYDRAALDRMLGEVEAGAARRQTSGR